MASSKWGCSFKMGLPAPLLKNKRPTKQEFWSVKTFRYSYVICLFSKAWIDLCLVSFFWSLQCFKLIQK